MSCTERLLLIFFLSIGLTTHLFAKQKRVAMAFKHESGLEIILVESSLDASSQPDPQDWTANDPEAGFFIGDEAKGYSQMLTGRPYQPYSPNGETRLYTEIYSRSPHHKTYREGLTIHIDVNKGKWLPKTATVACPSAVVCFTSVGKMRQKELTKKINQDLVDLFPLSEAREILSVLYSQQSERYFFIDYNRRGDRFSTIQIFEIRNGKIEYKEIVSPLNFRSDYGPFEYKFANGERIYHELMWSSELISATGVRERLVRVPTNPAILKDLGVPPEHYKEALSPTPCAVLGVSKPH